MIDQLTTEQLVSRKAIHLKSFQKLCSVQKFHANPARGFGRQVSTTEQLAKKILQLQGFFGSLALSNYLAEVDSDY